MCPRVEQVFLWLVMIGNFLIIIKDFETKFRNFPAKYLKPTRKRALMQSRKEVFLKTLRLSGFA
jgi:hypothetical protein